MVKKQDDKTKPQGKSKAQAKGKPQDTSALDLITLDDAAQILGTSRRTVQRLYESGKLKVYKRAFGIGAGRRPRLLDRAEVQALATSAEVVSE